MSVTAKKYYYYGILQRNTTIKRLLYGRSKKITRLVLFKFGGTSIHFTVNYIVEVVALIETY